MNRHRLREPDATKYRIYDSLVKNVPKSKSWAELERRLRADGIEIGFKTKGSTSQIEGVRFTAHDLSFNGSKVDRQFSYSKIDFALKQNARQHEFAQRPTFEPTQHHSTGSDGGLVGALFDILPGAKLTERLGQVIDEARKPIIRERKITIHLVAKEAVFIFIGMVILIAVLGSALYLATRPDYDRGDNDLKYRYIKMKGEASPDRIGELEDCLKINRDNTKIRKLRKDVEEYERLVQQQALRIEQARRTPPKQEN